MRIKAAAPTSEERFFERNEIIVSKTNTKGHITYANQVFLNVSGFTEHEVIGQPHNVIRHPDMPRGVFKLLWDRIQSGQEIFAFVKNICKDGAYYWVLAHVTPSFDPQGRIIGYHSNRRVPDLDALRTIKDIYSRLLQVERNCSNSKLAAQAGAQEMQAILTEHSLGYDEFIFTLLKGGIAA